VSSIRSVPPKLQAYRHVVYPFKDEQHAINAVFLFASSKLSKGKSVVLIMPDSRCEPITARLAEAGFDICDLQAKGQLECISTARMLERCRAVGTLDERIIKDATISIISQGRSHWSSGKVTELSEMVSLIQTPFQPDRNRVLNKVATVEQTARTVKEFAPGSDERPKTNAGQPNRRGRKSASKT